MFRSRLIQGRRLPLLLGVLLLSCGYRFTAGGGSFRGGIRRAYVPVLTNRTPEPGLEAIFTQSLREQLVRAGSAGDSSSEAQIVGEVLAVSGSPTLSTAGGLASYRLSATVALRLINKGVDVPNSWVQVSAQEEYLPGGNVLQSEANRSAALRRLADAVMRDAYDRLAAY
jgi:hypothetical protein